MEHHHALLIENCLDLAEESGIIPHADMLEHADRNDAVEPIPDSAIVLQLESDPIRQSALRRPLLGDTQLFFAQGDAQNVYAAGLRQIKAEPAPSRANIEHPLAALEQELRRAVT